jgi:hypothetical protein
MLQQCVRLSVGHNGGGYETMTACFEKGVEALTKGREPATERTGGLLRERLEVMFDE